MNKPTIHIRLYRSSVYAMFTHARIVHKFATGVTLTTDTYHPEQLSPEQRQKIDRVLTAVKQVVSQMPRDTDRRRIRALYDQFLLQVKPSISPVLSLIDDYVKQQQHLVTTSRIIRYGVMRQAWATFETNRQAQTELTDLSPALLAEWIHYLLTVRKIANNTVASYCSTMKGALNLMQPDRSWKFWTFKSYVPRVIYLHAPEIRQLWLAELPPEWQADRDLFLFACLTGLRFSDTQRVDQTWIVNGTLSYRQQKTDKEVLVPLSALAHAILERHGGAPPARSLPPFFGTVARRRFRS